MNLRCTYCQVPFTISRSEMLAALPKMEAENLRHYDAHCPNCRRANPVSKQRMELFFPHWKQALQEAMNAPAPAAPKPAPPAQPKPAAAQTAKPASKAKPVEKKPAAKKTTPKPAAKKSTPKPKPAAKKPAKKK